MDREKIKAWLDTSIEVAHELAGKRMLCGECTIRLPYDVASTIFGMGIFYKGEFGEFIYEIETRQTTLIVFVAPYIPKRGRAKFSIIVHK